MRKHTLKISNCSLGFTIHYRYMFFYQICLCYFYAIHALNLIFLWCCFDTFLMKYIEKLAFFSLFSRWSYFEKLQIIFKQLRHIYQLFLCVKKFSDVQIVYVKKILCVLAKFFAILFYVSNYFTENCHISVFDVMSTMSFFLTCSTYLVIAIT